MSKGSSPAAVLDAIAALPRGDDLARLVHTVAFAAADERRSSLADGLAEVADRAGLKAEDAETPLGNALRALEKGDAEAAGSESKALVSGLLARGVALSPPVGADAEARVAEALLWLATHTSVDALTSIDAALDDKAGGLWRAVAGWVRKIDAGRAPLLGRAGALVGAAALRESSSLAATDEAEALAADLRDPVVKSLLAASANEPPATRRSSAPSGAAPRDGGPDGAASGPGRARLAGEIVAPPRGPAALVLLGITGVLAAVYVARLVGRVALRYRRPAELFITGKDVTLKTSTELLGRTLREREVVIPIEALLKASREVSYPRAGLYAGLFALALGSYFGVRLLIDGVLVGAPEFIGIGALLAAAGVGLDFVLENVGSGMRGKCRVVFVPRKGRALAVGELDPAAADRALARLKRS